MHRRLRNLPHPPKTLEELLQQIQNAWNEIPQQAIDHLILSMPRRIQSCIRARGILTHY